MSKKLALKNLMAIACLIVIGGCSDDASDLEQPRCFCPEGQVCDLNGVCGNAGDLCGGEFCENGSECIDGKCVDSCVKDGSPVVCDPGFICIEGSCQEVASLVIEHPETPVTSEDGTSVEYKVYLSSKPSSDVKVLLSIENADSTRDPEATTTPTYLIFTPDDWDVPQTITVTGNDDGNQKTGSHTYYLVFSDFESEDSIFNGVSTPKIELTNLDNDQSAIMGSKNSVVTDESGASDTIDISLTSEPKADVTISVAISNPNEASTEIKEFTISKDDWNKPVTVVVTGVADYVIDEDQPYDVVFTSKSNDPNFNDSVLTVNGINKNIDTAGFSYVFKSSPEVHESASSKTDIEITLTSKPSSPVTIQSIVMDDTELALEGGEITIQPEDWNKPHTITVTGVSDNIIDGDQTTNVKLTAVSEDENFNGYSDDGIAIKTIDDDYDTSRLNVSSSDMILSENGGKSSFVIQLTSKPQAPVVIHLSSTDFGELRVDGPTTITIQPEDWDKPITVDIAAVDDQIVDGTQTVKIHIETSSDDKNFDGINTSTDEFSVTDDETASIVLVASSDELKPGSYSTTITAQLSYEPTDDVVVTLVTSDDDMAHLSTTTLVFTPENWNVGQVVTVSTEDISSAVATITPEQIYGTGASNCDAYNGIQSNVLDFNVYSYTVREYEDNSSVNDAECLVAYDTLLPGQYKLQVWGASGGDQVGLDQTKGSHAGLGGYAEGVLTLTEKTDISIHVGGQGSLGSTLYGENAVGGGCNGGAGGTVSKTTGAWGFGGGGGTDIRIGGDTYYHRVIVAGGGGGADDGDESTAGTLGDENDGSGGFGGGLVGGYGFSDGVALYTPGTQTNGHSFGEGEPAGFVSYSNDTGGGGEVGS